MRQRCCCGRCGDAAARRQQGQPWELLTPNWREVVDEIHPATPRDFHERHYNEFVTFLPYVQRFTLRRRPGRKRGAFAAGSPMRVFRRHDVAQVRAGVPARDAPLLLDIVHVDLVFFLGIDVVMLNVEVSANDLPLPRARDLLYRFDAPPGQLGRKTALRCMDSDRGSSAEGCVLARSDAQRHAGPSGARGQYRRTAHRRALNLHAGPLVGDHSGPHRRAALPPDRVLPHADDGLSGAGRAALR